MGVRQHIYFNFECPPKNQEKQQQFILVHPYTDATIHSSRTLPHHY